MVTRKFGLPLLVPAFGIISVAYAQFVPQSQANTAHTDVYFVVSAPPALAPGVLFNFSVTAFNPDNSLATGYAGIVRFSSSDPQASLPVSGPFNGGVGTYQAFLQTGGPQTITVTDTVNPLITGTSDPIAVATKAPTRFVVSTPANVTAGLPFVFTVSVRDQFDNPVAYSGRVRFSSTDLVAILPQESAISQGISSFTAILKTPGSQKITVTDVANPALTGTNPGSVVSAFRNLARGRPATQSSTLAGSTGDAALAVDGITDGDYFHGSVTHTNFENNPWWQVDLGASSPITSIVISNRTDCCGSRLNDYWVFVSDTPFNATDTPSLLQNRPGTFSSHQSLAPNPSTNIPTGNSRGRYVRLQLAGINFLSLAEVEVLSNPAPDWNLAPGKSVSQSSTLPGAPAAGAAAAVDGNTDGNFFGGSITHTSLDNDPWWQIDLGATTLIDSVVIYNRTDCCASRLSDYYIFVSNVPFGASDSIATLVARPGTSWTHQTAAPNPISAIFLGTVGRYVRVQIPGQNYLSLAEVQISGKPNLAGGKPATQSSTLPGSPTAVAASALDGSTDGNFYNGSVTHTDFDLNPWWQVDLGTSASIARIQIWNRTDCCAFRLNGFWIFVSNTPFDPSDTPDTLQSRPGTSAFQADRFFAPDPVFSLDYVGITGRYVRIQLPAPGNLSLAEVRVFTNP